MLFLTGTSTPATGSPSTLALDLSASSTPLVTDSGYIVILLIGILAVLVVDLVRRLFSD